MTFTEFVARLNEEPFDYRITEEAPVEKGRDSYGYSSDVRMVRFNGKMVPAFTLRWTSGGMTGGSCWGTSPEYPVESEEEPEWKDLDQVLEHFCPGITFLQYKRLLALAEMREDSDGGDYYGNYYTYKVRVLRLDAVYEFLSERKAFK